MAENTSTANGTHFDICIIGGGATGAGCALDAASRGMKVLLIEKNDFGSATSGKSTKLIHGGVRYLEQAVKKLSIAQYMMVRKALRERSTLLHIAPHITRPLQLITPCRSWVEGAYYYIGLKMYDWISGRSNLGGSELLGKKKALERIPTLQKDILYNAVLYYDGQLDDLRYNWALVQTAESLGAVCYNHTSITAFEKDAQGQLTGAHLHDHVSNRKFSISAKVFINATGPFADNIRQMANPQLQPRIRVSRGVHILLPKHIMRSASALLIPQTQDGRVIFAIPYQKHLLVGTTDDEAQLTEDTFGPTAAETAYLLNYINQYLSVKAGPGDVLAGFGGLRPLVMKDAGNTKDLVRDHEVENDKDSGLISILGGKWTTYRLMAKDCIDAAAVRLGNSTPCRTATIKLVGSQHFSQETAMALAKQSGWDHEIIKHLVSKYGDQGNAIAAMAEGNEALKERLHPGMPYTYAELHYVIAHEKAFTLQDILGQRWGTQLADWQQTLALIPAVVQVLAEKMGWDEATMQAHADTYKNQLRAMITEIQ